MANNDYFDIRVRALRLNKSLVSLAADINARGIPCIKQTLSRAIHRDVKTPRDTDILNAAHDILRKLETEGK